MCLTLSSALSPHRVTCTGEPGQQPLGVALVCVEVFVVQHRCPTSRWRTQADVRVHRQQPACSSNTVHMVSLKESVIGHVEGLSTSCLCL